MIEMGARYIAGSKRYLLLHSRRENIAKWIKNFGLKRHAPLKPLKKFPNKFADGRDVLVSRNEFH